MSKADEMFEKLSYKKIIENENTIQYEFEGFYMDNEIKFDLKGKTVIKEYSNGESEEITMQELQAINEKVKELGWNENIQRLGNIKNDYKRRDKRTELN